ncbi:MAG: PaREP1 family protein [Candidatus Nezhaarchaeales archaeon]
MLEGGGGLRGGIVMAGGGISITLSVPKVLYEKLAKSGLDVESLIVERLINESNLDPDEEAEARFELAEKYLREGESLIDKDSVQACEKLYKSAEEAIKALAIAERLGEADEAKKRNRWTLQLLDAAAKKLGEKVNERIYDDWDHAYFIHVEGFHEARLKPEQVKSRLKYVKELLDLARRHLMQ